MQTRKLGDFNVSALGLGCMSMSHAYGIPDDLESEKALLTALDLGYTFFDTAALYGFGKNEELLGRILKAHRDKFILASKCGVFKDESGKRAIDGRPETLQKTCEDSLRRLQTDVIDLYYLHRVDKNVPLEDSIGALAELVQAGKVRAIGLSEVSADTLHKAHAIHPITAVQSEYSLWSRNPEINVLNACKALGVSFVAFSPVGRGFLTGALHDISQLVEGDIRLGMPRFQKEHFSNNMRLLGKFAEIAEEQNCTMAQLALAWLLAQGQHIIPIPGTRHSDFVKENALAVDVQLTESSLLRLNKLINQKTVSGPRYPAATQLEIDTEEF